MKAELLFSSPISEESHSTGNKFLNITENKLHFYERLGSGSFGCVSRAEWTYSGEVKTKVAVKVGKFEKSVNQLKNEVNRCRIVFILISILEMKLSLGEYTEQTTSSKHH
jgi:hypothetical protein